MYDKEIIMGIDYKSCKIENQEMLVAFFDLLGFGRINRQNSSQKVFELFSDYYEFVGEIIETQGGTVVKFIADGGLIVFPDSKVDEGVSALKALKEKGDLWFSGRGVKTKIIIKAHFGPVTCGAIGTMTEKRFDLFGQTVNTAALITSNGLALSQQLFRKLKPETRKFFKKHTRPITYIPLEEYHKNH